MNNLPEVYCGVDISKEYLDVNIYPLNKFFKIKNNKNGMDKLIHELQKFIIKQIGCESTGGYEKLFVTILRKNSYKPRIIDPRKIKGFMAAKGIKGKTDKIDARMIAEFLSQNTLEYDPLVKTQNQEKLKALSDRRNDLTEMAASEKNRLKHPSHELSHKSIKKMIKIFEKEIAKVEKEMQNLINDDEDLKKKFETLGSVPGIGFVATSTLLSYVPELGQVGKKEISALIGLCPYNNESGKYNGKRSIRGGRSYPRKILYMSALSAKKHDPVLKNFYERLINKGKCFKVAIVAVMRKLVIVLNSMLKRGEMYKSGC